MNKLIITIAAMFLSAAALAQSTSTTEKTGVNSVLGMAPSTQDFVRGGDQ
jgi:putative membrane protein